MVSRWINALFHLSTGSRARAWIRRSDSVVQFCLVYVCACWRDTLCMYAWGLRPVLRLQTIWSVLSPSLIYVTVVFSSSRFLSLISYGVYITRSHFLFVDQNLAVCSFVISWPCANYVRMDCFVWELWLVRMRPSARFNEAIKLIVITAWIIGHFRRQSEWPHIRVISALLMPINTITHSVTWSLSFTFP